MARLSGNAIAQAGKTGQAFICGMNFYVSIPANIQAGTQTCAVDQQGFFVVSILNTYVTNGVTIPTREILTGPGVIDASNVERLIAGVLVGARGRRPKAGSFVGLIVVFAFFAIMGGAVFLGAPGWSS